MQAETKNAKRNVLKKTERRRLRIWNVKKKMKVVAGERQQTTHFELW